MVAANESTTFDATRWEPALVATAKQKEPPRDTDLPRLMNALQRIESHDYQTWINVGLALKGTNPDLFSVFEWWSKRSEKSQGCDLREKWNSLNPNGSVTLGTIYHLAKIDDQPKFQTYNLGSLLKDDFHVDYLIEGLLAARQPCLCVGPQKSMKTTMLLCMALSLSMGKHFLGRSCIRSRVLFMSGESGMATLQETVQRMLKTLGEQDADNFHLCPNLPRFDQPLDDLERLLSELKTEVLFIDPAYLCMAGGDAGNMFQMGQQLKHIADLCNKYGITLILAHHSTKSAGKENKPLELSDMAWAGFGEFARQWLMLSRRKNYVDGTGEHKLFLRAGGSAGHSSLLHLDISEGVYPNRHWNIEHRTSAEQAETKRGLQYSQDVEKVKEKLTESMSKTRLRDVTGIRSGRWIETFDRMLSEGVIEPVTEGSRPKFKLTSQH